MSEEHIKKIDGIDSRLIRLEERLPLQIDQLSGAIEDFRGEMGDAIRELSAAIKDQASFNKTVQDLAIQLDGVVSWKKEMALWKERLNRYMFATAVVATIIIWLLNQFAAPLIARIWK